MNVPAETDPLGLYREWFSYPQAVMTSNTTGKAKSGSPLPFPLTIQGGWNPGGGQPFRAIDGKADTYAMIDDVAFSTSRTTSSIILLFAHPVKFTRITVTACYNAGAGLNGQLALKYKDELDGTYKDLVEGYRKLAPIDNPTPMVFEINDESPLLKDLRITWGSSISYARIYEIAYEATYKP